MKLSRCLMLIALATAGGALFFSEGQAAAPTRKAQALKKRRAGDYVIGQIRPARSRKARRGLSKFQSLNRSVRTHYVENIVRSISRKSIADALIIAPGPDTVEVLREYGVPVIEGVPPIFFLFPQSEPESENENLQNLD
jgi:hypothetical protein